MHSTDTVINYATTDVVYRVVYLVVIVKIRYTKGIAIIIMDLRFRGRRIIGNTRLIGGGPRSIIKG